MNSSSSHKEPRSENKPAKNDSFSLNNLGAKSIWTLKCLRRFVSSFVICRKQASKTVRRQNNISNELCVCTQKKRKRTEKIMIKSGDLTAVSWTYFNWDTHTRHTDTHVSITSRGELSSSELIGSHVSSLQPLSVTHRQYSRHQLTRGQRDVPTLMYAHTEHAVLQPAVWEHVKIYEACRTPGAKPTNTRRRSPWCGSVSIEQIKESPVMHAATFRC